MKRIAILSHETHELFVEDINESVLNETYDGNLESYINDNYTLGKYSWDYITSASYIGEISPDPYDLGEEIDLLHQEDLSYEE